MAKYRKKPVVIEAMQYDGTLESYLDITEKMMKNEPKAVHQGFYAGGDTFEFRIVTLEGVHLVSPGDFVIRGVKGEFYPCKPDIFEQTYEAA
jgi:hypothetical protein